MAQPNQAQSTPTATDTSAGASIYSYILNIYDFYVLWISFTHYWRCPTSTTLLPFFQKHSSPSSQLDVAPGSGYFLANSPEFFSKNPETGKPNHLTLLDLNKASLQKTETRLKAVPQSQNLDIESIHGDAFEVRSILANRKFHSISLFNLLHCLPGPPARKAELLAEFASNLDPTPDPETGRESTIYGSTILGYGAEHNWLGRQHMRFYNNKGIFGNEEDTREVFEQALRERYESVDVEIRGVVMLFSASKPRK